MVKKKNNKNKNALIKLILINILITIVLLFVNIIDLFEKNEIVYNFNNQYYSNYNIIYNIQESDEMFYESEFIVTAYCGCEKCCGKSDEITASGSIARENHTIAVDTDVIPYGTVVEIDGIYYVAEDTGGLIDGNRIDIYFKSHQEAINYEKQIKSVKIFKNMY